MWGVNFLQERICVYKFANIGWQIFTWTNPSYKFPGGGRQMVTWADPYLQVPKCMGFFKLEWICAFKFQGLGLSGCFLAKMQSKLWNKRQGNWRLRMPTCFQPPWKKTGGHGPKMLERVWLKYVSLSRLYSSRNEKFHLQMGVFAGAGRHSDLHQVGCVCNEDIARRALLATTKLCMWRTPFPKV